MRDSRIQVQRSGSLGHRAPAMALIGCGLLPGVAQAAEGIDDLINNAVAPLTAFVSKVIFYSVPVFGADLPLVVLWLIAGAVFFTIYFGFINVRGFKHAIQLARGDYADILHTPAKYLTSKHFLRPCREQSALAI